MQIRTDPDSLDTTTKAAQNGVSLVTCEITPKRSILSKLSHICWSKEGERLGI